MNADIKSAEAGGLGNLAFLFEGAFAALHAPAAASMYHACRSIQKTFSLLASPTYIDCKLIGRGRRGLQYRKVELWAA